MMTTRFKWLMGLMVLINILITFGITALTASGASAEPASAASAGYVTIHQGEALNLSTGMVVSAKSVPGDPCTDEFICFYDCTNAGCGHWFTNSSVSGCQALGVDRLGNSMNNRTSWIVNDGIWPFRVYDYITCGGAEGFIGAHTTGAMNAYWNDHIGSTIREPCYPIACLTHSRQSAYALAG